MVNLTSLQMAEHVTLQTHTAQQNRLYITSFYSPLAITQGVAHQWENPESYATSCLRTITKSWHSITKKA